MKRGQLSEYFEGTAIKRLSAVEADETRSNQHEYNATKPMLTFMGRPTEPTTLPARFLYLGNESDEPIVEDAFLTLYDSRARQSHRSAEYRFYFPTTAVSLKASPGDLLLIAKRRAEGLLIVIAAAESSAVGQIEWLFGVTGDDLYKFAVRTDEQLKSNVIGFAATAILESIGIEVTQRDDGHLEAMLKCFQGSFPSTRDFSTYARKTLNGVDPRESPDEALMAWMEREELLFRILERHLIGERLARGFDADHIDDFIHFSLSVQNRRKSRVGLALENHIEVILSCMGIHYARTAVTENRSKPDFLFPGKHEYHDTSFDPLRLTMLAVKSTCKDRWRQVLAEADRVRNKHLLTMETSISENQTNEMQSKHLQLVVPRSLHVTYTAARQSWLLDLDGFTRCVLDRQQSVTRLL